MFNAKLWINPEKNWFQIIFLSTYSPLRKFQNSRKYKTFKTEVDTQIGLLNLWVYDIVVLLHHFLFSNFITTTVRFLVECQEEEEVLNTGECEHQRCSHGIVTSEEERLKQSTDEKMNGSSEEYSLAIKISWHHQEFPFVLPKLWWKQSLVIKTFDIYREYIMLPGEHEGRPR